MKLLSVIIPAYNAEKWIECCIDSILRVTVPYEDALEVIVVNDGSSDKTSEKVKAKSEKLKEEREKVKAKSEKLKEEVKVAQASSRVPCGVNVKLIDQENQGLSGARNAGLKVAEGKYIAFVDADDEWCENLSLPWEMMQEGKMEIIGLDMVRRTSDGVVSPYRRYKPSYGKIYTPALQFLCGRNLFPSACANLYAKAFLERENLVFTPGIYHEDEDFTTRAFLFARSFVAVKGPHYLYIERKNSITTNTDPQKLKKRMTDLLFILKRLESFSEPEQQKALRCKILFLATDTVRVLLKNTNDQTLIHETLDGLRQLGLYPFPFYPNLHYLLVKLSLELRV